MSQAQRWGPGRSQESRGKALAILESVAYCFPPLALCQNHWWVERALRNNLI